MQVAIYAGVPAGVDSFRIAREVSLERAQERRRFQQAVSGTGHRILLGRRKAVLGEAYVAELDKG
jgi:hypothetical protein